MLHPRSSIRITCARAPSCPSPCGLSLGCHARPACAHFHHLIMTDYQNHDHQHYHHHQGFKGIVACQNNHDHPYLTDRSRSRLKLSSSTAKTFETTINTAKPCPPLSFWGAKINFFRFFWHLPKIPKYRKLISWYMGGCKPLTEKRR